MIGFDLAPEQAALQDTVHRFSANEIRPVAAECDRDGRFPEELFRNGFELGLMTGFIPESLGGLGLGAFEGCLIEEELGWGCAGIASSMTANGLALGPVLVAGSDEQKERFV